MQSGLRAAHDTERTGHGREVEGGAAGLVLEAGAPPAGTPVATVLAHQMPSRGPAATLDWLVVGSVSPHPAASLTSPNPPTAEEKKKLAEEKAVEIEEQNKVIAVEKAEAETALAEVMPILEAAKLELQKLDKSDVTEIR